MSIYLKVKNISGNVNVRGYDNSIEVLNYTLAASRSINNKHGLVQNRTAGLVHFSSLSFSKVIDKSSTDLLQHFYSAKVIPEMQFCHVSTGTNPQCYLVNTFYDALINRFDESNHSEGVLETIEISFSRYEKRNMPLDKNLKATSAYTVGYDLQKASLI